jgi:formylglycine-generating enzyme required for sulfatase activity
LLLDGLDEAPGRMEREAMARLFEKATRAYNRCRFVVTTRPLAYVGETVLDGFEVAQIEPLEPQAIDKFLEHWCHELFRESPKEAESHLAELTEALRATAEIRRMARNPVMLTALAVVHWNERRLPEQRADLYHSILTWLSRSREKRSGREPAARCLTLLEQLALAMQDHPQGRKAEVSKGEAALMLASHFPAEAEAKRRRKAHDFIAQEEVDSGIIVSRGSEVRFWHLTFQEYLAAKAIGGLLDAEQYKLLLAGDKIYRPEWREVVLLLSGVLRQSGAQKVDGLVGEILNRLGERASLGERARCVGLLGAMVRDLSPLGYEPADPRYKSTLESVLGIFDARKAATVELSVRLEAAEALGQAGDPRLRENNWIKIEPGSFRMGAQKAHAAQPNYDPEAEDNESPVDEVYLDAYQIGRYPVTVEEYKHFVEDEGYTNQQWWSAGGFGQKKPGSWDEQVLHPNWPVVEVSWYEAAAYCAWLSDRLRREVRLPTEAEWERAARGTAGRKYPWGKEGPDSERANLAGNVGHPTPVGLYPRGATPEGIEDLAGNVWEWVADRYDKYKKASANNPKGPTSGASRVVRGGSWYYGQFVARAAFRSISDPVNRVNYFGFRVVGAVPSS